jgi:hypothetical protein
MHQLNSTNGVITVVQEHRFQLKQDNGQHRLFILAHNAPQEWSELQTLKDKEQPVTVYFSENEKLIAATAHDVWQR